MNCPAPSSWLLIPSIVAFGSSVSGHGSRAVDRVADQSTPNKRLTPAEMSETSHQGPKTQSEVRAFLEHPKTPLVAVVEDVAVAVDATAAADAVVAAAHFRLNLVLWREP